MELTEAETEYAVNVVKHIFNSHVVFQYNCTNTIPEQLLENVLTNLRKIVYIYLLLLLFWLNFIQICNNHFCLLARSLLLLMRLKQRNSLK